jgi:hypothetical protein
MSNHERFEELCALAAAGEISTAERLELMGHLEDCESCRETFGDVKEIHATWLPERTGFEIKRSAEAESKLTQSILQRVAAEGARFSPSPEVVVHHRPSRILQRAFAVAAVIVITFFGIWPVGRVRGPGAPSEVPRLIISGPQDPQATAAIA